MNKLGLKSSLLFILIYIILTNVGALLSEKMNVNYLGQILLLLALAVLLINYIRNNKLAKEIGIVKINFHEAKKNLLYLPLFIMVLANGVFFFDKSIAFKNILFAIGYMILVAFLEELLFRGLLFKTIEKHNTTKTAIAISGVTFGFGHIVNLLNGYTAIDQIMQIVIAVLIGIVLSILFVRTKSIIPGVIFHFFFNIASVLSVDVLALYNYTSMGIISIIALIYIIYLTKSTPELEKINEEI